jgi:hypothetical protein
MQTAWREDYSHREARYFLQGMEWIDLLLASPLALVDSLIKNGPGIGYMIEAIASTIHCQRPSRKNGLSLME